MPTRCAFKRTFEWKPEARKSPELNRADITKRLFPLLEVVIFLDHTVKGPGRVKLIVSLVDQHLVPDAHISFRVKSGVQGFNRIASRLMIIDET